MTLKELYLKIKHRDAYDTLLWLNWLSEKIDCKSCVKTRKQFSGNPPNCSKCIPTYKLIKQNFREKGDFTDEKD